VSKPENSEDPMQARINALNQKILQKSGSLSQHKSASNQKDIDDYGSWTASVDDHAWATPYDWDVPKDYPAIMKKLEKDKKEE